MTSELAVRTPGLSVAMKNARKSAQANAKGRPQTRQ